MTEPGEIHHMSLMLGELKNSVEVMTDMWSRQEAAAVEGRRKLHEKFEAFQRDVNHQLAKLTGRVDRMAMQIRVIEPSVKVFNEEKLREEGAKRLGAKMIAAITAAAGVIGWGVHELISRFWH